MRCRDAGSGDKTNLPAIRWNVSLPTCVCARATNLSSLSLPLSPPLPLWRTHFHTDRQYGPLGSLASHKHNSRCSWYRQHRRLNFTFYIVNIALYLTKEIKQKTWCLQSSTAASAHRDCVCARAMRTYLITFSAALPTRRRPTAPPPSRSLLFSHILHKFILDNVGNFYYSRDENLPRWRHRRTRAQKRSCTWNAFNVRSV